MRSLGDKELETIRRDCVLRVSGFLSQNEVRELRERVLQLWPGVGARKAISQVDYDKPLTCAKIMCFGEAI
jgi:hypothetical protein